MSSPITICFVHTGNIGLWVREDSADIIEADLRAAAWISMAASAWKRSQWTRRIPTQTD